MPELFIIILFFFVYGTKIRLMKFPVCRQGLTRRNSEPQLCAAISVHSRNCFEHRCTGNFIGPIRQRQQIRRTVEKRTPATSQGKDAPDSSWLLRDNAGAHVLYSSPPFMPSSVSCSCHHCCIHAASGRCFYLNALIVTL